MLSSILLTKLAHDAGFDVELGIEDGWLKFGLPGSELVAWIKAENGSQVIALSRVDVLRELNQGTIWQGPQPTFGVGALEVPTGNDVIALLARARVLDRTLPNALLEEYQAAVAQVDRTEAEALVKQRRGQEVFRRGLMDYWQGRCAITRFAVPELLRASHIKAWAYCETDAERLDVFNGLLLVAHLDAAFDSGLITIADSGDVIVSSGLSSAQRALLGLDAPRRVNALAEGHRKYLPWQRGKVFRA
jgi:putative restriction endonuclease